MDTKEISRPSACRRYPLRSLARRELERALACDHPLYGMVRVPGRLATLPHEDDEEPPEKELPFERDFSLTPLLHPFSPVATRAPTRLVRLYSHARTERARLANRGLPLLHERERVVLDRELENVSKTARVWAHLRPAIARRNRLLRLPHAHPACEPAPRPVAPELTGHISGMARRTTRPHERVHPRPNRPPRSHQALQAGPPPASATSG